MAGRVGTFLAAQSFVYGDANPALSDELNELTAIEYPPAPAYYEPHDRASYGGRSAYRMPASNRWPIVGAEQGNFFRDYYFRVHVTPGEIDFGSIITAKTRVSVWNAKLVPVTLSSVGMEPGAGVTASGYAVPTTYPALFDGTWTITASADGAAIVDGPMTWDFVGTNYGALRVKVLRVTVWPFPPRSEFIESLSWKTDVLRTKTSEQRICLRKVPRREYKHEHVADEADVALARNLVRKGTWYFSPDWPQAVRVASLAAGSNVTIPADLTGVELGQYALIWKSPREWEQVEIIAGKIAEIAVSWTDARIIPVRRARPLDGLSIQRPAGRWATMSMTLEGADGSDLGAAIRYPQYRGHDVIDERNAVGSGSFTEGVAWDTDLVDNGFAEPYVSRVRDYPDVTFMMRWLARTPAEIASIRGWIYSRKGRQKSFWLPSWARDLNITNSATAGVLIVAEYDPDESDIAISTGGVLSFFRITGATQITGGWSLTIDGVQPAVIDRAMYLRHVRFNADRIEMRYTSGAGVEVSVPCIEVPV